MTHVLVRIAIRILVFTGHVDDMFTCGDMDIFSTCLVQAVDCRNLMKCWINGRIIL